MEFDPTKPVSHCLHRGKKLAVKNFRRRSGFDRKHWPIEEYPYIASIQSDRGEFYEDVFSATGNNLSNGTGSFQLVNKPEPAPVNWDEPITFEVYPDEKLEHVGIVSSGNDELDGLHIIRNITGGGFCLRKEDGTTKGGGSRVINVPTPKKTVKVGVAIGNSGVLRSFTVEPSGKIVLQGVHGDWHYKTFDDFYKGGWHILIEPKEVELPE